MKHFLASLLTLTVFTFANAQSSNTGDWCAEVKKLQHFAVTDTGKVTAEKLSSDDYTTTYRCPLLLPDAARAETHYYTEGRLSSIVVHYGPGVTGAAAEKLFQSLLGKLKSCFTDVVEMDYAYELGYGQAWSYSNEDEFYTIRVGTLSNAVIVDDPKQRSAAMVVIEFH